MLFAKSAILSICTTMSHPFVSLALADHSWKPFSASEYEEFNVSNVYMSFRFHLPMLLLYPYYLLRESELYGFSGNHFNPWSSMFGPNDRLDAAVSSFRCVHACVCAPCMHVFGNIRRRSPCVASPKEGDNSIKPELNHVQSTDL